MTDTMCNHENVLCFFPNKCKFTTPPSITTEFRVITISSIRQQNNSE